MAAPVGSVGGVDVDLAFDTRPVSDDGASAQPAEPPLGGLGLILDDEAAPALPMPSAQTLERKLDLADEFVTIGDPEAARDLLNEVLAQGDTVLQARAQSALSRLG